MKMIFLLESWLVSHVFRFFLFIILLWPYFVYIFCCEKLISNSNKKKRLFFQPQSTTLWKMHQKRHRKTFDVIRLQNNARRSSHFICTWMRYFINNSILIKKKWKRALFSIQNSLLWKLSMLEQCLWQVLLRRLQRAYFSFV